eukprot:comp23433_c0_seq1/m.39014 comp23433_c0_seq1/g.39014  ORF comp23433_c0_seq1/g.39014 comp23433_c0_seq1/m.39014 type:complete len:1187 (-) comp23433_c0_seq1:186-3746(-)
MNHNGHSHGQMAITRFPAVMAAQDSAPQHMLHHSILDYLNNPQQEDLQDPTLYPADTTSRHAKELFVRKGYHALPDALLRELQRPELVEKKAGVFGELGCVWMTLDKKVVLWQYERQGLTGWDEAKGVILAVGLTRLKEDTTGRQYVLVVVTASEVTLVVVYMEENGRLVFGDAIGSVPTCGILYSAVATTENGRIFLGGSDGVLTELSYSTSSRSWWSSSNIILEKRSSGFLTNILGNGFFGREDVIIRQLAVSDASRIVYALIERGSSKFEIETWYLGETAQGIQKIATVEHRGPSQTGPSPVVTMEVASGYLYDLVVISPKGERTYYINTYDHRNVPINTALYQHVDTRGIGPLQNASVVKGYYSEGVTAMAIHHTQTPTTTANDLNVALVFFGPDYLGRIEAAATQNQQGASEGYSILSMDYHISEIAAIAEKPMYVRQDYPNLVNTGMVDGELLVGNLLPRREFIVVTDAGVYVFEKLRRLDSLATAIEFSYPILNEPSSTRLPVPMSTVYSVFTSFYAQLFQLCCDRRTSKAVRYSARQRLVLAGRSYANLVSGSTGRGLVPAQQALVQPYQQQGGYDQGMPTQPQPLAGLMLYLSWIVRPLTTSRGGETMNLFGYQQTDRNSVFVSKVMFDHEREALQEMLAMVDDFLRSNFEWPHDQRDRAGALRLVVEQIQQGLALLEILYGALYDSSTGEVCLEYFLDSEQQARLAAILQKLSSAPLWELLWREDVQKDVEVQIGLLMQELRNQATLEDLRRRCPGFFSELTYADQILQGAKSIAQADSKQAAVDAAIKLILKAPRPDIQRFHEIMAKLLELQEYRQLVEVALALLAKAEDAASHGLAEEKHYCERLSQVCNESIMKAVFEEDGNSCAPKSPAKIQALHLAVSKDKGQLVWAIFDRLAHGSSQDHVCLLGLRTLNPALETFLVDQLDEVEREMRATMSLSEEEALAINSGLIEIAMLPHMYYVQGRDYLATAQVLTRIAKMDGDMPFATRRGIIARALPYAKVQGNMDVNWQTSDQRTQLKEELIELGKVVEIEEMIYVDMQAKLENENPTSTRAEQLKQDMRKMGQGIFDGTTLYTLAESHQLYASLFTIMRATKHYDMVLIREVWPRAIDSARDERQVMDLLNEVKRRTGGTEYWGDSGCLDDMMEKVKHKFSHAACDEVRNLIQINVTGVTGS